MITPTFRPGAHLSPLNVWDMQLTQGHDVSLHQPAGWSTALVFLKVKSALTALKMRAKGSWWC
ncbi:Uncharacterised protein [Raoultella terrigena]|uniref:Uncharacterized protein n=1 Tax=Raoultella terrigena TaxID=577 RepID=A0A4U9DGR6_RAOTE|nr:Uncharacterised protein [Raoultella terrigena]